jgi:phosphotransferase system HPr (HPr) family protein
MPAPQTLAVAAARFSSAVSLTVRGGSTADAKSVLGVMRLGATTGQQVTVSAEGADAAAAVAARNRVVAIVALCGWPPPGSR